MKRKFQATFSDSVLGVKCLGWKPASAKTWSDCGNAPEEVAQFLQVKRFSEKSEHWIVQDVKNCDEIRANSGDGKFFRVMRRGNAPGSLRIEFTVDSPDPKDVVLEKYAGIVSQIEKTLVEKNDGRNLDCWPLNSFGGKDADLNPGGCCGIARIVGAGKWGVKVEVGGHKTFCDPTYECEFELSDEDRESYSESAHGIVCDAPGNGEWTGDDWSWSFRETIVVPWVMDRGRIQVEPTADAIIAEAEKVCDVYGEGWASVDNTLNELYEEIQAKAEGQEVDGDDEGDESCGG